MGIGPLCARREQIDKIRKEQGDDDEILPYDGGDIWIERRQATMIGRTGEETVGTHPASGVRTNVPRFEYRHSPTGFNFGYGGSGPADFALNTLLLFCVDKQDAYHNYQNFKAVFVAPCQSDRLVIPKAEILEYLHQLGIRAKSAVPEVEPLLEEYGDADHVPPYVLEKP